MTDDLTTVTGIHCAVRRAARPTIWHHIAGWTICLLAIAASWAVVIGAFAATWRILQWALVQ